MQRFPFWELYSYDKTIFDGMSIPTGIDKQNLISNICMELAEFEILYPNAATMKQAIEFWSKKRNCRSGKNYLQQQNLDYNPIYNYDRTEEITETETETKSGTHEDTRGTSGTSSGTASNTNSGADTVQNDVSAFNETELAKKDRVNHHAWDAEQRHKQRHVNADRENSDGSTNENNSRSNARSVRAFGNIGVTTTQQMLPLRIYAISRENLPSLCRIAGLSFRVWHRCGTLFGIVL